MVLILLFRQTGLVVKEGAEMNWQNGEEMLEKMIVLPLATQNNRTYDFCGGFVGGR